MGCSRHSPEEREKDAFTYANDFTAEHRIIFLPHVQFIQKVVPTGEFRDTDL